jgi:hypothetical protein
MIRLEDKKRILKAKINSIEMTIPLIEEHESVEGKPSHQEILDNLISEKNTYVQLLAEL